MDKTQQKSKKPFQWSQIKKIAAFEIAKGLEPKTVIAAQIGVHRKTLEYWLQNAEFSGYVQEMRERILLQTEEHLISNLSEPVLKIRSVLDAKFANAGEIDKMPADKLLTELRKYLETILKVQKSGVPVHATHDVNVNYQGKIQIEKILEDIQDIDQKESFQKKLIMVAGEILEDKEKEWRDQQPTDYP